MQISFQSSIDKNSTPESQASLACLNSLLARTDLGFFRLPNNDQLWEQAQKVTSEMSKKFKRYVWVGIGGSSLGPKAIAAALELSQFDFIENPDIKTLNKFHSSKVNFKEVGFVFVSKSGTTIETLAILDYFHTQLRSQGLNLAQQSLAITELKSSSLYDWAKENHTPILEIPLNVGGRFSVLSSVGQTIIGLAQKNLSAFREGTLSSFHTSYKNETLLPMIQFYMQGLEQKQILTYFWYYSDSSYLLGKWLEQLWAESLGKKESPLYVASVPVVALGANDQHSVLQQMMETPLKKSVVIHRFADSEVETPKLTECLFKETKSLLGKSIGTLLKTQAQAMTESQKQIQNHALEVKMDSLNEFALGQYFMNYKLIVGALGEYMKIDAFNQPGVELCKIITKKTLGAL